MLLDHPSDEPAAIRTQFGAIFVSLELSRSNWLVTSLSPGKGEKMSKHNVAAGDIAGLLQLFAELKRRAQARTGQDYPIITIQEAGLDGFWLHRVLQQEGIESHVVDPASIATPRRRRRAMTDRLDGETLVRGVFASKRGAAPGGRAGWGDAVAGASRLQARRAAGVRDGGCAFARGGGSAADLSRTGDADCRADRACEPDQGAFVRPGHIRLRAVAAARSASAACGIAHRRRAGAAGAFEGADRPRARSDRNAAPKE